MFTSNVKLLFQAFEELEVGGVIADDMSTFRIDHMPYGGVKDSGMGREGLRYAIEEMTEPRILVMRLAQSPARTATTHGYSATNVAFRGEYSDATTVISRIPAITASDQSAGLGRHSLAIIFAPTKQGSPPILDARNRKRGNKSASAKYSARSPGSQMHSRNTQ